MGAWARYKADSCDARCHLQIIGEPPRPELHKKKAPAGNSVLKQALVEEAAHMFDLEHDDTMVRSKPSTSRVSDANIHHCPFLATQKRSQATNMKVFIARADTLRAV